MFNKNKKKIEILERMLFGKCDELSSPERSGSLYSPAKEDNDVSLSIQWAGDDGLIVYLVKRIKKLENEIGMLQVQNSPMSITCHGKIGVGTNKRGRPKGSKNKK